MKGFGRHLLVALFCLLLGYGGIGLSGHVNAQENLTRRGAATIDNTVSAQAASDEATTLAIPAPSPSESYLNGVAYSSPLVIPAAAFRSQDSEWDNYSFDVFDGSMGGIGSGGGCVIAPAYLPNGATIDQMVASVYDNEKLMNMAIYLSRVDNFGGGANTVARAESSNHSDTVRIVTDAGIDPAVAVVEYPYYAYWVDTCLGTPDLRIYSVQIYFHRGPPTLPMPISK